MTDSKIYLNKFLTHCFAFSLIFTFSAWMNSIVSAEHRENWKAGRLSETFINFVLPFHAAFWYFSWTDGLTSVHTLFRCMFSRRNFASTLINGYSLHHRYGLKYSPCTLIRIYKVIYHHYITTKELYITWLDIPIKLIYKIYCLGTRKIFVSFTQ